MDGWQESMDLSIIIVTRNTAAQMCEAIESVRASVDGLEKEFIVVDNGSTDDTGRQIAERFPAVRYLSAERNLGFARACNLGVRGTRGEFLLLLNSDARLAPDALERAATWMRAHAECGIIGAQLLHQDGSRQNSIANFPTLATELLNKSLLRRLLPKRFPGKEQFLTGPVAVESVVGAFLLSRRKLWDQLGGLDERYFFFLEETDFCLRARRCGALTFHLPEVKVWHGQGQSAKKMPAAARIEYWRSRYAYFRRHHSGFSCQFLRFGLLLRLLVDWIAACLVVLCTFGQSSRWREKFMTQNALIAWHGKGCPEGAGLPR